MDIPNGIEDGKSYTAGSATFLINIHRSIQSRVRSKEKREMAKRTFDITREKISGSDIDGLVKAEDYQYRGGCIVASISLATVVGATFVFVNNYKTIKNNLKEICKDIGKLNFLLKRIIGNEDNPEKDAEIIIVGEKSMIEKYEEFKMEERKIVERSYEDGTKERVTKHSIAHMKLDLKTPKEMAKD